MKNSKALNVLKMLLSAGKYMKFFKMWHKLDKTKIALIKAYIELGKLNYNDPAYTKCVKEFNQGIINLTKGKWYAQQAMETNSKEDTNKAFSGFKRAEKIGNNLTVFLKNGSGEFNEHKIPEITSKDTEIIFADDIPITPSICPVIVLQGSDYEMGYQYAQQVIQIYGSWILEAKAGIEFSNEEIEILKNWENQIKEYTPEILGMIEGWAAGATDAGVPMSYYDVLELWVDHKPPKTSYMGMKDRTPKDLPTFACSGVAAWGKATDDGKLVTGSSGDHDPYFNATIIAFPETGNNFMFSTFSVVGSLPFLGNIHMFGHPGMNSKGVTYVEHGGLARMVEPKKYWGYGIRRATSIMHVLRFANTAKEARDIELNFPIGDVGVDNGTVGGFYADSNYGYVLESRKDPVIVRESGVMGENDFLYAHNSALHPDSGKAGWMQKNKENWSWDEHGGWHPSKFKGAKMNISTILTVRDRVSYSLGMVYNGSYQRSKHTFNTLNDALGKIDLEFMKQMYRNPGTFPSGSWKEISNIYNKTGSWGEASIGNASNGIIAVTKPDDGLYAVCIGHALWGMPPASPAAASCNFVYDETNTFWELKLASDPRGIIKYAKKRALNYIEDGSKELSKLEKSKISYNTLKELMDIAKNEFKDGEEYENANECNEGNETLYNLAKAIRAYTRAQVRAKQVCNALTSSNKKSVT